MVIQVRGILGHDLMCILYCIRSVKLWAFFEGFLFFWMFIVKEVLDGSRACCSLIYSEACCELDMSPNLDRVKQKKSIGLAVVTDQIICWPFLPYVMDYHFT